MISFLCTILYSWYFTSKSFIHLQLAFALSSSCSSSCSSLSIISSLSLLDWPLCSSFVPFSLHASAFVFCISFSLCLRRWVGLRCPRPTLQATWPSGFPPTLLESFLALPFLCDSPRILLVGHQYWVSVSQVQVCLLVLLGKAIICSFAKAMDQAESGPWPQVVQ